MISTAAAYPPSSGPAISLAGSVVPSGALLRVHGNGFATSSKVSLDLHSQPVHLASPGTDALGSFDGVVMIPAGMAPGHHTLTASGTDAAGVPASVSAQITVLPPAATGDPGLDARPFEGAAAVVPSLGVTANQVDALGPSGEPAGVLPHTGSGPEVALALGAALVAVLGGFLVMISRQRRPRRSPGL